MASFLPGVGTHPDLPDTFVHMTGRPRSSTDRLPSFATGSAESRMVQILQEGYLRGAPVFGSTLPVICFGEPTEAARRVMLRDGVVASRGPYEPWGLIFDRRRLINAGARPALYMPKDEIDNAAAVLGELFRSRCVRYEPGKADWLHEREWRISFDSDAEPTLKLTKGLVVGVIVGEQGWMPPPVTTTQSSRFAHPNTFPEELRTAIGPLVGTITYTHNRFSEAADQLARWWWNGEELVEDGVFEVHAQMREQARRDGDQLKLTWPSPA